jgi:gamma-polyglutamate synthase
VDAFPNAAHTVYTPDCAFAAPTARVLLLPSGCACSCQVRAAGEEPAGPPGNKVKCFIWLSASGDMLHGFGLLLGLTLLVLIGGLIETRLHRRRLGRIPIRIHVNGTRGKSSVTRLITAGLREAGITTCAKTTGTLPRIILPDGREHSIQRPAAPNVIEQLRIVRVAVELKAKALVVECMALQPYLQWLSESRMVRATHGVITNARADHLDVMGPTEEDVALSLAGGVPVGGRLFTAERRHLAVFRRAAADRSSTCIEIDPENADLPGPEEMEGFRYVEHPENVALALRVCLDLGVDRQVALRGMKKAAPDPGAMSTDEIQFLGGRVVFVNGFAANDPESTQRIWRIALEKFPAVHKRIAVFNCRLDRPDRSLQLGRACANWESADHYVLMGSGVSIFARAAVRAGLNRQKLVWASARRIEDIFNTVIALTGDKGGAGAPPATRPVESRYHTLIMGMGNIGGQGLELVQYIHERSLARDADD